MQSLRVQVGEEGSVRGTHKGPVATRLVKLSLSEKISSSSSSFLWVAICAGDTDGTARRVCVRWSA